MMGGHKEGERRMSTEHVWEPAAFFQSGTRVNVVTSPRGKE